MIRELTNHVWQSTLFAAAAGLMTVAFRRNRAQVRYWLWFSASFKFLIPFALLLSLGGHLKWVPASGSAAVAPAVSVAMEQVTEPFPAAVPLAPSPQGTRDWLPMAVAGLWACGFLGLAATRFRGWRRVRAAVRASTPIDIPGALSVRSSPGLLEPGVVGMWRPTLLLPGGIEQGLTPPQLEAVLAHELCHVRRRDNLFAAIHMMVEALFWFNPLVWWIGARLLEERERACDEEVLRLGSEPRVYAEAILNVCKLYAESPLVCVSGVTGADLKQRIEAILTNRIALRINFPRKVALVVGGLAALAAPLIVGGLNAPSIRAQAAAAGPKFEVASIKPCRVTDLGGGPAGGKRKGGGGGPNSSPGRLSTGCDTVADLIRDAYISYATGHLVRDPSDPKVSGGPEWIQSDRYEIDAKAEGNRSQGMMRGPMLQTLLEERFKLKVRRESREVPVYLLTVAKDGPKLAPFQEGECIPIEFGLVPAPRPANACRAILSKGQGSNLKADADGIPLGSLTKLLFLVMDRPVIDRTGIAGLFDFHFEFAMDETTPALDPRGDRAFPAAATADELGGPSIITVLQKQFGLKLEPGKGPREFFAVDHVERPSEN